MKTVAIIFVALGILAVPTLSIQVKLKESANRPTKPNHIITSERYAKIKNRTSQWKPYKPDANPFYLL